MKARFALTAAILAAISSPAFAFTSGEKQAIEEAMIALDVESSKAQPGQPAEIEVGSAATSRTLIPTYRVSDPNRIMIPVDVVIPFSSIGQLNTGVTSDEKRSYAGNIGVSAGAQVLSWLRKDSDGFIAQMLKSVGISADWLSHNKYDSKFTDFLYTYERTGTRTYTQEEWRNQYYNNNCTETYYCSNGSTGGGYGSGSNICCTYTYNVDVYGTPDGSYVAWQRQSVGIRVWVPLANIKDRLKVNAGVGPRFHDLAYANNSDSAAGNTWRTSWNWSVEGSVRLIGALEAGAGYEQSFKGFQNRQAKVFIRYDFGRAISR